MSTNKYAIVIFAVTFAIILLVASGPSYIHNTEVENTVPSTPTETPQPTPTITPETTQIPEPTKTPEPKPFIRYQLTSAERSIVERVVMAEAENQSLRGQMAVAQCILTTAEATGQRPDAVVSVPGQYAPPASYATESVKQAVSAVFDNGERASEEDIRYFYAPKGGHSAWHETSLKYVATIGDHRFFR